MNTQNSPDAIAEFLGAPPPSKYARLIQWGGLAIVTVLVIWLAWTWLGGGNEESAYATAQVERGDLRVTISATGNLQPINQVDVGSELSGTVMQVLVDNNDRVIQGQVLARLDTARLQDSVRQSSAALESAQASVAQALASAEQARANLARLEHVSRLSGGKVPAPAEMDIARADATRADANVRAAQAGVAQARAQLSSDQTQLSKAIIRSPVTGVILARQIEPGQTVAASLNAPVLFTIAQDLAQMQLEVKVDEADVGQVRSGQRATFQVDAFPGRTFPAEVKRIDLGANAGTSSSSSSTSSSSGSVVAYTAVLGVDNRTLDLRPGMTATADIITAERKGVLMVPNAALRFAPQDGAASSAQSSGSGVTSVLVPRPLQRGTGTERDVAIGRGSLQAIYIIGQNGKPERVEVTVGDTNGSQTEVSGKGVRAGMQVIVGQLAATAEKDA